MADEKNWSTEKEQMLIALGRIESKEALASWIEINGSCRFPQLIKDRFFELNQQLLFSLEEVA